MEETPVKILIVEDVLKEAEQIKRGLQAQNYKVTDIVPSAEKALASIRINLPDLVIMDIGLEGPIDGIEAANMIYEKWKLPIIYLSVKDEVNEYRRAKRNILAEYVAKPFILINILNAIDSIRKTIEHSNKDLVGTKQQDILILKNKNSQITIPVESFIYATNAITQENEHGANSSVTSVVRLYADGMDPYPLSYGLSELERKMKPYNFVVRCAQKYLVNIKKIKEISPAPKNQSLVANTNSRDKILTLKNGKQIPLGRNYKVKVLRHFRNL